MPIQHTPSLARLLQQLEKLPGVGPKTAQRLAFHLLRVPKEEAQALAKAIADVREKVGTCARCFHFAEEELCPLCKDESRDQTTLCVVADSRDLMAIENAGEYRGLYHVLHGLISPIDGIGPDDLKIAELIERIKRQPIREVILALSPTPEGDVTASHIAKLIRPLGVKVTQIAMGIPAGGDLDYADQMTIIRALEGRREVE